MEIVKRQGIKCLLSWHTSPNDKFDFNDGKDKIEVKSTKTVRRVHKFSLEQLHPNINSNLIIASVFVIETGHGKTILLNYKRLLTADVFKIGVISHCCKKQVFQCIRINLAHICILLNNDINSNLIIASVFVIETGHGKTIFDLKDSICKKVSNFELQYRLNEVNLQFSSTPS